MEGVLKITAWNVLFVGFFIFYLVRAGRTINRVGLLDYMKTFRNVTRLIVLVLCIFCFVTAGFHSYLSMKFHSEFQKQTHTSYFDFDSFIFHFSNLKSGMSLLFCVAVVRSMLLFRGGRRFLNHLYTIKLSWNWIFWLMVIIFTLIIFLYYVILNFNIFAGYGVLQLVVNQRISPYLSLKDMSSPKVLIFIFIKILSLAVIKSFFLIIFVYNSKIAKFYDMKKTDHFSFVTFLPFLFRKKIFPKIPFF